MPNWTREKPTRPPPYTKSTDNQEMLRVGEMVVTEKQCVPTGFQMKTHIQGNAYLYLLSKRGH